MDETGRPPRHTVASRAGDGETRLTLEEDVAAVTGAAESPAACAEPTWSEKDRLAALEHYGILDSGREPAFDDMAALVADLLDAPIVVVNLIAADRQWFKAEVGIGTDSLPLDVSICRHAILQPGVMVVPDLRDDPRFEGNPLIHVEGGLRFYAGALLETPDGLPLGTLCVLDREPRPEGLSDCQKRALAVLASQTMAQIELRRAKEEAQAAARRQSFLLTLEERLRDLLDPQEIMATATELLGGELGAGRVAYVQVDEAAGLGRVARSFTQNGMPDAVGEYPLGLLGPLLEEFRSGRTVVVTDTQGDDRASQMADTPEARATQVRAALDVPLVKAGRLVAILSVNDAEPRAWTPQEARLVETVAERTWAAVERARAETGLRKSEARYRGIVEGAEDFAIVTLDEHGIITGWNTGAERIVGFSETEALGQHGEIFFTPKDRQLGAPDHEMNRAHSDGRALDERWHLRKDGSRFWGSGLMMRLDPPGAGYLKIFRDRTAEHEGEAQLRRRSEQLLGLAEVATAVAHAPSLEATLNEITHAARRIIGAHQGVTSLTKGADWSQAINSVAITENYDRWRDYAVMPDGSGIYAWLCEQNRPARFTQAELEAHPRWRGFGRHASEHPPMRGWLAAPLVSRDGRNLGLLQLSDKEDGSEFDEADEAMLVQLAQLASAAVEQSLTEAAVRANEERLRAIVETATDYAIFTTDAEGRIETWPNGAQEIFGWSAQEAVGQSDALIFTPEDRAQGRPEWERQEARNTGQAPNVRWHLRKDDTRVFIEGMARPLRNEDGSLTGFVKVGQDVTERRATEEALRRSEEQLRLATEAAEIGLWDVDPLNDELFWPPRVKAMFGISADKPVSMADFYAGLHPDDRHATSEAFAAALDPARRALYDVEYRTIGKEDGRVRWIAAKGRGVFDGQDRCIRVIGTAIDITARKAVEEQLRELNETLEVRVAEALAERQLLADFVENTSTSILAFDLDYRILAINKANADEIERVYGKRPKVGDNLLDLLADMPEHQAQVARTWGRALAGEEFTVVDEFGDAAHERATYEVRFNVLRDPDGKQIGALQTVFDVSDRVRAQAELAEAQEALRQSQKLDAMGQLTGGVAHDFNNLLTPIIASLDMLLRRGLGSQREQRLMDGALQSAERAKVLVQRLLAFARKQPLQPGPVDVRRLVSEMADLIASTTGPRIDVRVELSDDLPPALADANQLEMALLNLAVNARDAMPDGGVLTISANRETVRLSRSAKLPPGHYVRLSVQDTGSGMDEATLARAVEPFFSTKGIGKGTGLGLSMVHGLAAQLGGGLTIDSHLGQGTTVSLWLPVSTVAIEEDRGSPLPVVADQVHGTALLVDDEDLVRMSTADMLMDLGYKVVEVRSAGEALSLVEGGLHPDLVVTDHLMPGMTGLDLARELRSRRPALPVLIASGYAEMDGIAPGFARLTKPFRATELAESLEALTAERMT